VECLELARRQLCIQQVVLMMMRMMIMIMIMVPTPVPSTVRNLKASAQLQGKKQPIFVEINGQRLPTPHHLYTGNCKSQI
jgi:hypothetical protein